MIVCTTILLRLMVDRGLLYFFHERENRLYIVDASILSVVAPVMSARSLVHLT